MDKTSGMLMLSLSLFFYEPMISFLSIYPKNKKITNLKRHMHTYIHCKAIDTSQGLEITQ